MRHRDSLWYSKLYGNVEGKICIYSLTVELKTFLNYYYIHLLVFSYVCICKHTHACTCKYMCIWGTCMPQQTSVGQSCFSFSTIWISGIELRYSTWQQEPLPGNPSYRTCALEIQGKLKKIGINLAKIMSGYFGIGRHNEDF